MTNTQAKNRITIAKWHLDIALRATQEIPDGDIDHTDTLAYIEAELRKLSNELTKLSLK